MGEWWDEDFARTYKEGTTQEEALAAGERLLSRPDFPHQEQLRKNITYWLPRLPGVSSPLDIDYAMPEGWSQFNPSVASDPDGNLRVIMRRSNYVMSPEGRYGGAYDTEGVIRTRNYIATLKGASLYHAEHIEDDHLRPDPSLFPVHGFEDCRLFWFGGWKFSATVRERNARGICQQVMCDLDGNRAENLVELSPAHDTHQKNWMPFSFEGPHFYNHPPRFIHSCYPLIMLDAEQPAPYGGEIRDTPYIARNFRGGAAVPCRSSWCGTCLLAIIHESIDFPNQSPHRVYWHRFVEINPDIGWEITRISQPFCFQRRGVEFCAGMALKGDDLILSYGVHDKEAWLHRMPLQDALDMLHPVTEE